jgi:hypothetical protein
VQALATIGSPHTGLAEARADGPAFVRLAHTFTAEVARVRAAISLILTDEHVVREDPTDRAPLTADTEFIVREASAVDADAAVAVAERRKTDADTQIGVANVARPIAVGIVFASPGRTWLRLACALAAEIAIRVVDAFVVPIDTGETTREEAERANLAAGTRWIVGRTNSLCANATFTGADIRVVDACAELDIANLAGTSTMVIRTAFSIGDAVAIPLRGVLIAIATRSLAAPDYAGMSLLAAKLAAILAIVMRTALCLGIDAGDRESRAKLETSRATCLLEYLSAGVGKEAFPIAALAVADLLDRAAGLLFDENRFAPIDLGQTERAIGTALAIAALVLDLTALESTDVPLRTAEAVIALPCTSAGIAAGVNTGLETGSAAGQAVVGTLPGRTAAAGPAGTGFRVGIRTADAVEAPAVGATVGRGGAAAGALAGGTSWRIGRRNRRPGAGGAGVGLMGAGSAGDGGATNPEKSFEDGATGGSLAN